MHTTISTISPADVHERAAKGEACLLLDVRTPVEHREVHVAGVELMPLDALDPEAVRRLSDGKPIYLFCRSGSRATQAAERLAAAGVARCQVVTGGTLAWDEAGLPVVRGKAAMSLERQVRIAAGALVIAGAILAETIHHAFIGLSAFVGTGLVFAGVTDWCGMGLLLAKMPWNRVRDARCPVSRPDAVTVESAP